MLRCGTCPDKKKFKSYRALKMHWKKTGCNTRDDVWRKVHEAKQRGSSGRRILSAAYPRFYKREPMSEETKEKLRALGEKRKALNLGEHRQRRQKAVKSLRHPGSAGRSRSVRRKR